jgi:hypothetical protein
MRRRRFGERSKEPFDCMKRPMVNAAPVASDKPAIALDFYRRDCPDLWT